MADFEALNAAHVPPQQLEDRKRARLAVADYVTRTCGPSVRQNKAKCGELIEMLGLEPKHDHDPMVTQLSRGQITNSTAVRTRDAQRRKSHA